MDALILAAGLGSRIREVAPCKPLTKIHGLSLLEISIRQLAAAGATRVVVATGYMADEIHAELPAIAARVGIHVEAQLVDDFHKPNGYSVLAGSAGFDGDFLLVMADHIFSLEVLKPLVKRKGSCDGAILAIDRGTISPLIDPDDATWVATGQHGNIRQIGKTLECYDCVDCGAFLASQALPLAIQAAIDAGMPGSLSDGMQRLADQGQASTVDIGNAWWIDVDDARALELAQTQIRENVADLFEQAAL